MCIRRILSLQNYMFEEIERHLDKSDLVELLSLGYEILRSQNRVEIKNTLYSLKNLLPVNSIACGVGNIVDLLKGDDGKVDLLNIGYPKEYLDIWFNEKLYQTDLVLLEVLEKQAVTNWQSVEEIYGNDYAASQLAADFGLNDGWAAGHLNPDSLECFALFFGKSTIGDCARSKAIIEYILPFCVNSYVVKSNKNFSEIKLTPKEIEVLNWVKFGKSSWEISVILKCSKRVVDFHVSNFKRKLNVTSRAQAVAIALRERLIPY